MSGSSSVEQQLVLVLASYFMLLIFFFCTCHGAKAVRARLKGEALPLLLSFIWVLVRRQ